MKPDSPGPERSVLLATRSTDKLREIREILGSGVRLTGLDDLGLDPDPAEDGIEAFESFAENALAKARYFAARTGRAALSDDSGIVVPALGGRPGVHSKRFAESLGVRPDPEDRDATNLRLLLREAVALRGPDRDAYYACAAALVVPGPSGSARELVFTGTVRGILADQAAGSGGFGYDPIFLVPSLGRTFAQVPSELKHGLSHRAHAFRALRTALRAALESGIPTG